MAYELETALGVLSVLGSVVAAYLSYIIYSRNRLSKAVLGITAAFVLVIFRRALGFARDAGYVDSSPSMVLLENVLLLVISGLYIWGFWDLKKRFEKIDLVTKGK